MARTKSRMKARTKSVVADELAQSLNDSVAKGIRKMENFATATSVLSPKATQEPTLVGRKAKKVAKRMLKEAKRTKKAARKQCREVRKVAFGHAKAMKLEAKSILQSR